MFAGMTIRAFYRDYLHSLQSVYVPLEATVITDLVFEELASVKKADLIRDPNRLLDTHIQSRLEDARVELLNHKPLQYVLGFCWFHHLKFSVNDSVLIPRPETEELVSLVINDQKKNSERETPGKIRILDIGTGSGCIPISLKKYLPGAELTAIDLSEKALLVAKENALAHHTEINFIQMDFLDEENWKNLPLFDVIISNPPYIPLGEKEELDKNVTEFEPHIALFVPDEDPLVFYRKIARFGMEHLSNQGRIYLETHAHYARPAADLFRDHYPGVKIKQDFLGRDRMILAGQ